MERHFLQWCGYCENAHVLINDTNEIRWVTHTQKRDESKRESIFMENEIRQYWMGQDVIIGVNMIKILLSVYTKIPYYLADVYFLEKPA